MNSAKLTKGVKYSLVITDIIICLSGIIMLIAGSVVQGQINSNGLAKTIGGYSTTSGSVICIIFGIAVLLFGAFGLYAALRDHHRFLTLYAVAMFVVFIIQFITGVVGLSVKNSSKFTTYVENVFAADFTLNSPNAGERDFFQTNYKCCGWKGSENYLNGTELEAPPSCCDPGKNKNCTGSVKADLFQDNCGSKIIDASKRVIEAACGILVTFAIFNFISILLSLFMSRQIKSGYQYT